MLDYIKDGQVAKFETSINKEIYSRGRTLLNPVLPAWIKYTYVQQYSHGLLYGVPVYQGLENIEVQFKII